jgi:hypothetical protein
MIALVAVVALIIAGCQANPRYANRAVFECRGARFYTDFFIR